MIRYSSLFVLAMVVTFLGAAPAAEDNIAAIVELCDLLEDGKVAEAKALLIKNPKLSNAQHPYGNVTALHVAAKYGHIEIVKLLLKQGAKVNALDWHDTTPLHEAGNADVAKLLIEHKANLEAKAEWGTPLVLAAYKCQNDAPPGADNWRRITKVLLDAGARYDILSAVLLGDTDRVRAILKTDSKQALDKTLVIEAAIGGRAEIMQLLLDNNADPNTTDGSYRNSDPPPVVYHALKHPDVLRVLLKAGVDPKRELPHMANFSYQGAKTTLLHCAAEMGQIESAKVLLEAGVDIQSRNSAWKETPLAAAAGSGQPEMVKFLLKNKASIRGKDGAMTMEVAANRIIPGQNNEESAAYKSVIAILQDAGVPLDFVTAVKIGDTEHVRTLLKCVPILSFGKDSRGRSMLTCAAALAHTDIVTALLDAGAPINGKDSSGYTALQHAVPSGKEDTVKLLISRHADVNASSAFGVTPLHLAGQSHTAAITKLLLDAGAKVNAKTDNGTTPLHQAVRFDSPAVDVLLKAGANVNAKDNEGVTPLHRAAQLHDPAIAGRLLAAGADINAKTKKGDTPLDWAFKSNNEMIDFLKKHGGK
jgi:cytohesin